MREREQKMTLALGMSSTSNTYHNELIEEVKRKYKFIEIYNGIRALRDFSKYWKSLKRKKK